MICKWVTFTWVMWCEATLIPKKLPFFVPELWDEFLVTLAEGRLFVCPNQTAAVQEELSERRTGEEKKRMRKNRHNQANGSTSFQDETLPVG